MADKDYAPLSTACVRALNDRFGLFSLTISITMIKKMMMMSLSMLKMKISISVCISNMWPEHQVGYLICKRDLEFLESVLR